MNKIFVPVNSIPVGEMTRKKRRAFYNTKIYCAGCKKKIAIKSAWVAKDKHTQNPIYVCESCANKKTRG